MVRLRSLLAGLVASVTLHGCCWALFEEAAFDRLDRLVDDYRVALITQSSCYSRPTESDRNLCYAAASLRVAGAASMVNLAKEAIEDCNQQAFDSALANLRNAILGTVVSVGNLATPVDQVDLQATGGSSGDMLTTVTLGSGATLRATFAPGAPMVGPYSLAGSFTADLQAAGQSFVGPVTALAISASMPGQPSWQLTLSPSAGNQCSLLPPAAGVRTGQLNALVLLGSGNTWWPLLLRMPLRVSADLSSWDLSTAGMVPASRLLPPAPSSNTRLGRGCPGVSGSTPGIGIASVPRVGDPLLVHLDLARPLSAGLLIVGDSSTTFGGLGLPLDLAIAGAPGCLLRVSPVLLLSVATNSAGTAQLSLPIPNDPSLASATVYPQWLVLDPVNPLGAVLSGAMRTSFYPR